MAAFDLFEKEVRELMRQGLSLDEAFRVVINTYADMADYADKLLIIKQKIAREVKGLDRRKSR